MVGEFKVFMVATVPRLCLEENGFSMIDIHEHPSVIFPQML